MDRVETRAQSEAMLAAMEAGGDPEKALLARMIRGFGFGYEDSVNDEVARYHAEGRNEAHVFQTALKLLATHIGFIVDHLVMRGMTRQVAGEMAMEVVSRSAAREQQMKHDSHYVPETIDRPGFKGFDFREMMKGQG